MLTEQLMAFARPPGNVNPYWELRVCAELISISPLIFFFPRLYIVVVAMAAVAFQL